MKSHNIFLFYLLLLSISSCAQESRYVTAFADTKAYELAKAVERKDLRKIGRLVEEDSSLLNVTNPTSGSNVLALALRVGEYDVLEKLLELGADPNAINPYTKHSILIDAVKPFGSQLEWRKEPQYVELLLNSGADPNYAIEAPFTNDKKEYVIATSPLMRAARLDLNVLKLLIKHGADPHKKLGERQLALLGEAIGASKFDIIDYLIDDIGLDVNQPMRVRKNDSLFIQDYIKKFMNYQEGSEGDKNKQKLIEKLERLGVDFKNYDYKL